MQSYKKYSPFKCALHLHLHAQSHAHLRCYTTYTGHTYFRAGTFKVGFEGCPAETSGTTYKIISIPFKRELNT